MIPSFAGTKVVRIRGKAYVKLAFDGLNGEQVRAALRIVSRRLGKRATVTLDESDPMGEIVLSCEPRRQAGSRQDQTVRWVETIGQQAALQFAAELLNVSTAEPSQQSAEHPARQPRQGHRHGRRRPGGSRVAYLQL